MVKVYFDKKNHWVESLEDYYYFKAVDFQTKEEVLEHFKQRD